MDSNTLGLVIIIGVGLFVGYRLSIGMRRRSAAMRTLHGPLAGGTTTSRPPGSAAEISDASTVPVRELFAALRVAEVPELDAEGEPNDVAGLGLRLHEGSTSHSTGTSRTAGRPQVIEGSRNGHQVFIRQGQVGDGDGLGIGFRKLRAVTVVRVEAPAFELRAHDGAFSPRASAPGEVMGAIADLSPSTDVWHDVRVISGAEGIIATRGYGNDFLGGWTYDLWLLERLAAKLNAGPLDNVRLGRDWTIPYGLGNWAPSALETLQGEG